MPWIQTRCSLNRHSQINSMPDHNPSKPTPAIGQSIPYERFLDCVHCGLCTSACPTYVETGDENDSPRGRIYLMRSVIDGRLDLTEKVKGHLDLCLDCRSCETACPSGVQYVATDRTVSSGHAAGTDGSFRHALGCRNTYPTRLVSSLDHVWPVSQSSQNVLGIGSRSLDAKNSNWTALWRPSV